jgi:hypothetical protein
MMHRLKLFLLSILAVFMLGAVASAVASAEVNLPLFTVETGAKFTSKKSTLFIEGQKITCEKDKGTTTATSKKLGTFTVDFEECKGPATVGGCWSLGDEVNTTKTLGTILLGGEYHLVRPPKSEASALIWFLLSKEDKEEAAAPKLKPVHIECAKLVKLILVWGNLLCKITPFGSLTAVYTVNCKPKGKEGEEDEKQELTEYENNAGTVVTGNHLVGTVDEGAEREVGEETEEEVTMTKETKIEYP